MTLVKNILHSLPSLHFLLFCSYASSFSLSEIIAGVSSSQPPPTGKSPATQRHAKHPSTSDQWFEHQGLTAERGRLHPCPPILDSTVGLPAKTPWTKLVRITRNRSWPRPSFWQWRLVRGCWMKASEGRKGGSPPKKVRSPSVWDRRKYGRQRKKLWLKEVLRRK